MMTEVGTQDVTSLFHCESAAAGISTDKIKLIVSVT